MVSTPIGTRIALRATVRQASQSDIVKALLGAQLVAVAVILLYSFAWLQPPGLAVYDALRVAWAGPPTSARLLVLGASESDIHRWGWPLKDDNLADILERLLAWKARVIGVDIYRDRPIPPGSERLKALLAAHPEIDWVFKLPEGDHDTIPPPEVLNGSDRAVFADIPVDTDGVVRRGLLFADVGTASYTGMSTALALAYLAREHIMPATTPDGDIKLGKAVIPVLDDASGPYVRLDNGGYQVLLDYRGGPQPFPLKTIADLMDSDDLADLVRNRIVIVGVAADSVKKNSFLTPFSTGFGSAPSAYGSIMHAHLADQLIRLAVNGDGILRGFHRPTETVLIWLTAVLGAAFGYFVRYSAPALIGAAGGLAAIGSMTYFAFGISVFLPCVPLLASWIGSIGLTNRLLYAATNRERARLRRSFEHYLPPAVIADMMASRSLPKLGGERREISVIFTDIQNFTTLSETMDPEVLAALLNDYFAGACEAIFAQGGLVYEFIGDAILAFFNAPHEQPDHADRAVDAALALDAFAYPFCHAQRERGVQFGITRIGIHTGIALVGNIGTASRLKYTAMGDMLNTGSRLEGLNKVIGTRICVSGETVRQCRRHSFRPIADFVVKGRHEKISVFEPIDQPTTDRTPLAEYQAAFDAWMSGRPEAGDLFADMCRRFPADPCVAFHHHRLANGEQDTLIVMTEK